MFTKLKIDVTKIPKDKLFRGKKGVYLDAILKENKDGPDQYGNDGFIAMDSKQGEERGAIIGNWKYIGKKAAPPAQTIAKPKPPADPDLDSDNEDEIPF